MRIRFVCLFLLIITLILLLPFGGLAQNFDEFETGKIVEVVAKSDAELSYALYLPTSYHLNKKTPILYCFAPFARGRNPVAIFQMAAEKYGYILVGSNNSKNGLDGANLSKILNVLWDDTHLRLNIDERRVYAAGFSGGARVASLFAFACQGCVAGVIGNGAGFSSTVKPSADLPFIFFGAIGIDDYNYPEMRRLEKSLVEAHISNRVETFVGGHQWLSKEVAERALAWLELQAMRDGRREKNEMFIDTELRFQADEAKRLLLSGQVFEAYSIYAGIVRTFAGLHDTNEFAKKAEELKTSKELKKAIQSEEEQIRRQLRYAAELKMLGAKLLILEERQIGLQETRSYINKLKKIADAPQDNPERRVARRSLNHIYAESLETAMFRNKPAKQFDLAMVNLELATEIQPNDFSAWFELAQAYALTGRKKQALEALTQAVERGFKNAKLLETENNLAVIRQEALFQRLLAELKQSN